jgi:hypothetical protein
MSVEDLLTNLAETARTKRVRYSEVISVCDAVLIELDRLREIEVKWLTIHSI